MKFKVINYKTSLDIINYFKLYCCLRKKQNIYIYAHILFWIIFNLTGAEFFLALWKLKSERYLKEKLKKVCQICYQHFMTLDGSSWSDGIFKIWNSACFWVCKYWRKVGGINDLPIFFNTVW